jgi:hypothetical protein
MSRSQSHARKWLREFHTFHPGRSVYEWIVSRAYKRNRKAMIDNISMRNPFFEKLTAREPAKELFYKGEPIVWTGTFVGPHLPTMVFCHE